jgi:hypothetical protein
LRTTLATNINTTMTVVTQGRDQRRGGVLDGDVKNRLGHKAGASDRGVGLQL